jgi:hypothetical protein
MPSGPQCGGSGSSWSAWETLAELREALDACVVLVEDADNAEASCGASRAGELARDPLALSTTGRPQRRGKAPPL